MKEKTLLRRIRKILKTPECEDIIVHAKNVMQRLKISGWCLQCGMSFELHICPKNEHRIKTISQVNKSKAGEH